MVSFNLRLEEETNDKLNEIAKTENRSKNKQIEYIIQEFIKKYEEEKHSSYKG